MKSPMRSPRCFPTRDAGVLQVAIDRATMAIANRHGEGPITGRIQALVIVATG